MYQVLQNYLVEQVSNFDSISKTVKEFAAIAKRTGDSVYSLSPCHKNEFEDVLESVVKIEIGSYGFRDAIEAYLMEADEGSEAEAELLKYFTTEWSDNEANWSIEKDMITSVIEQPKLFEDSWIEGLLAQQSSELTAKADIVWDKIRTAKEKGRFALDMNLLDGI